MRRLSFLGVLFGLALALFPLLGQGQALGEKPFVTRWQCRVGEVIEVPLVGQYAYSWGLASSSSPAPVSMANVPEGGVLRLYAPTPGVYLLKAGGQGVRYIQFRRESPTAPRGTPKALLRIEAWGDVQWETMRGAFGYCENMELSPEAGKPNLSHVADMSHAFFLCRSFNTSINHWDVSSVTNMTALFEACRTFNQPLNDWDVRNVKSMDYMFTQCYAFNQPLNDWDVSNVMRFRYMFNQCHSFNQPLDRWDISRANSLQVMFRMCYAFNQDLSAWRPTTGDLSRMFEDCFKVNFPVSGWQIRATNLERTFRNCHAFNQDLSGWDVSQVKNMDEMLTNCYSFDQSLAGWTPAQAKRIGLRGSGMSAAHYSATLVSWAAKQAQLASDVEVDAGWLRYSVVGQVARGQLEVGKGWVFHDDRPAGAGAARPFVTTWQGQAGGTVSVPIAGRYTYTWQRADGSGPVISESVEVREGGVITLPTAAKALYRLSVSPEQVRCIRFWDPIEGRNVGSAEALRTVEQFGDVLWETMEHAFVRCNQMRFAAGIDVPKLRYVRSMKSMLSGCKVFNSPLNDWDVSSVTNMESLFASCHLFNQPLSNWNVSKVTAMSSMFYRCYAFNQDLSSWDVSKVKYMGNLFYDCRAFNQPLDGWDVRSAQYMNSMFSNCWVFNQPLGSWNVSKVTSMHRMFDRCYAFNQPLDGWNVGQVTNMESMFEQCRAFNGSVSGWNVSKVQSMARMFMECPEFNQPLGGWDVRQVRSMEHMLTGCYKFDQSLGSWDPRAVQRIGLDFSGLSQASYTATLQGWASKLSNLPYNVHVKADWLHYGEAGQLARSELIAQRGWRFFGDVLEGTLPGNPFVTHWSKGSGGQVSVPLVGRYRYSWRRLPDGVPQKAHVEVTPGSVLALPTPSDGIYELSVEPAGVRYITFYDLLEGTVGSHDNLLTLESWGDVRWQSMRHAFFRCANMQFGPNPGTPILTDVRNMTSMFNGARKFNSPIQDWDVSHVEEMINLFQSASSFNQPLDGWDVARVVEMYKLLEGAVSFDQSLGSWTPRQTKSIHLGKSKMGYASYESTLRGWAARRMQLRQGVVVRAPGLKYSPAAYLYRMQLINERGWIFEGDGPEPPVTALAPRLPAGLLAKVVMGQTIRIEVTPTPADASPSNLIWAVQDDRYARVDPDGTVHGLAIGNTRLTVSSASDPDVKLVYDLYVLDPAAVPPDELSFAQSEYRVSLGETLQLAGEVVYSPENTTLRDVQWSKDASSSISLNAADGLVRGMALGMSQVTVKSVEDLQVLATCIVRVVPKAQTLSIANAPATLNVGDRHTFQVVVTPAESIPDVRWSVVGTGATFSGSELTVLHAGPVEVTATLVADPTKSATVTVTVVAPPPPKPLQRVSFKEKRYTLTLGQELELADEVIITPADATSPEVRFSDDASGAVSLDATGKVTAQMVGVSTVLVRSVAYPALMDGCQVRVLAQPTGVQVTNAPVRLEVNSTHTFTASVAPGDAQQDVRWAVTAGAGATFVGSELTVTQVGTITVTVTTVAQPAQSQSVVVEVVHPGALTGLAFTQPEYLMTVGEARPLAGEVVYAPADAANKAVTWAKDASGAISLAPTGQVSALEVGQSTITITSQEQADLTASCVVKVYAVPQSVQIPDAPPQLAVNDMYLFSASVQPSGALQEVAWSVDEGDQWGTFSGNMLVVKRKGTITVRATTVGTPAKSHTVTVEVVEPGALVPLTGIMLAQGEYVLRPGEKLPLLDQVVYDPLSASNKAIIWSTDASGAVSVSSAGVVTALTPGQATITAKSAANPALEARCVVKVVLEPSSVAITNAPAQLQLDAAYAFEAKVLPAGVQQDVTWSVEPVDAGAFAGNVLTVTKTGRVTITATTVATPPLSVSVDVDIVDTHPLAKIAFAKPEYVIAKGETLPLGSGSSNRWMRLTRS